MKPARAFLTSIPLVLVLVAAVVVPLSLAPGTFRFRAWPSPASPRVAAQPLAEPAVAVIRVAAPFEPYAGGTSIAHFVPPTVPQVPRAPRPAPTGPRQPPVSAPHPTLPPPAPAPAPAPPPAPSPVPTPTPPTPATAAATTPPAGDGTQPADTPTAPAAGEGHLKLARVAPDEAAAASDDGESADSGAADENGQ
ncbi:MAG: hypothetical protein NVS2B6_07940 [Thermoleophilaceae bacterium]